MSHTVTVGEFKGPLGVLLDLIDRGKLNVSEVSVGDITASFLENIKHLPKITPDEMSDFLQLGARLLYIKSLALLPEVDSGEQHRELSQLNIELAEYRRFQTAAKMLGASTGTRTWQRTATAHLPVTDLPVPHISLEQLADAFGRALKFAPVATPAVVIKPHLSLEVVTQNLTKLLADGFELQTVIERCHDRLEIVVTFLAILELVRSGVAAVSQASQFDAIHVEAAHG